MDMDIMGWFLLLKPYPHCVIIWLWMAMGRSSKPIYLWTIKNVNWKQHDVCALCGFTLRYIDPCRYLKYHIVSSNIQMTSNLEMLAFLPCFHGGYWAPMYMEI